MYSLPQIPQASQVYASNIELVRLYPSTFVNVESLDVSYNRLEEFSPNATERPSLLRNLALQGNVALTNFTFLRSLTSLNTLNMAEMNLSAFDFDLLSSMPYVSDLNMSHSNISELSANISGKVIDLSGNAITRVVSNAFPCYSRYRYGECKIDLSNNNIIIIEEDAFMDVSYVNLKNNNISDGIHPNAFKGVNELILSNNDLSNFDFLQQLQSLRKLNLSYVPYFSRCTTSCNVFGKLGSLEILDLSNNGITEIPVGIFSGMVSLRALNLRHNSISYIEYGTFASTIRNPNWSPNSDAIAEVDLSYNKLSELDFSLFTSGRSINRLLLHGNEIQNIPDDIANFGLSTLGLQNTRVTCPNLVKLTLKGIYIVNDHDNEPVFDKPNVRGIPCVSGRVL
ncbi:leucine-rich repeat-containing protein 15-like [Anopheles albimanus]|uniref:leucine-rich repeat-containing protein 15-like n=1 Tax=Anopheles albimanus TaxID=7167 RepID=UPI00163EC3AC|nr:leucine-rich repeat-containing protein 15-like [Anopheles albimanus]